MSFYVPVSQIFLNILARADLVSASNYAILGDREMGRKVALLMTDMVDIVKSLTPAANPNIPVLRSGDVVRVHARIVEGERERIQVFQGTIIRNIGRGISASFTVRRIASNSIGVERTFLLLSPRIEKVEVMRHSMVRRAKLYFLRETTGKASRLKESRQASK